MDFKETDESMYINADITKTCRQLHVTKLTIFRWIKQDDSIPVEHVEKYCWVTVQKGKR